MRVIDLQCSHCRCLLTAAFTGPGPGRGAGVEFFRREDHAVPLDRCPQCDKDFSRVTAERLLADLASWS
jgi:hypothetical protein